MSSEWLQKAQAWVDADVDTNDIAAVRGLIAAGDVAELETLFCRSAKFGTAGLREIVGPGPGQLNSAVVRRATFAVGKSLLEQNPDPATHTVVLGWDARLSSERFANDTAGVLLAMGIRVRYFDSPAPTPIVAYALLQYSASAGVVITASHNGPQYNGYKLYAKNGAQIVSPVDEIIALEIEAGPGAKDIPFVASALGGAQALARVVEPELVERYFADIARLRPADAPRRDLPMVYTPLHGVGGAFVQRAFADAGFDKLTVVAEQFEPDGHFSTLKSPDGSVVDPNPESGLALDLARKRGNEVGAELLLANDPDADRLAVNVRDEAGDWRQLTGNQIGILLADYQLSRYRGSNGLLVYSIVSTPMVESSAREYSARAEPTFTGFKWLWTAALALEQSEGLHYLFGLEEAIGYCSFDQVHD
jgi:phosphomannomutase